MHIRHLETAIVSIPLPRPIRTPIHHIETVDNVLITLRTDTGLEGIAYLWAFGVARARVLQAMVHDLFRVVDGADPRQRGALWQAMWRDLNFLGRAGVGTFALSALDTAINDLAAKAAGAPLWRFLGGSGDPVPVYAGGLFLSDPIASIVEEARDYVARGFRAVKMRVGAASPAEDIERVAAVREAIGPDVRLMVDVVQGWTKADAIRRARALEAYDLFYIEDPLLFDEVDAMAELAAAIDTPIAAGENNYGRGEFRHLIERRAVDIPMIDLQRVGGVTEWLRVAALCEAHKLPVVPHVFHEISLHLVAAAANALFLEYVPWWEVLFKGGPALVDGTMVPPSEPGLGLRFDRDAMSEHLVK